MWTLLTLFEASPSCHIALGQDPHTLLVSSIPSFLHVGTCSTSAHGRKSTREWDPVGQSLAAGTLSAWRNPTQKTQLGLWPVASPGVNQGLECYSLPEIKGKMEALSP